MIPRRAFRRHISDASARDGVAIAPHEEVVEISPELLSYLRSTQL